MQMLLSCVRLNIRMLDVTCSKKNKQKAMKLQNNFAASSPPHPNQPSPLNSFFFNADEIGLFWQSLPNSSLAEASESSA